MPRATKASKVVAPRQEAPEPASRKPGSKRVRKQQTKGLALTEDVRARAAELENSFWKKPDTIKQYGGKVAAGQAWLLQQDDPSLLGAFDKPNDKTAEALTLFLVYECEVKGLGISVANHIHAGFKLFFATKHGCKVRATCYCFVSLLMQYRMLPGSSRQLCVPATSHAGSAIRRTMPITSASSSPSRRRKARRMSAMR
jgi:hypothetical protein